MSREALAIVGPATWNPLVPLLEKALSDQGLSFRLDAYGFEGQSRLWAGEEAGFESDPPRGVFVIPDSRVLFAEYLTDTKTPIPPEERASEAVQFLVNAIGAITERHPAISWIIATLEPMYPGPADLVADPAADPFGVAVEEFNRLVRAASRREAGWGIFDRGRLTGRWGANCLHDPRLELLARIPGSATGMQLLAERIAAHWAAVCGKMKKVLALDCDNTLWGGIVGEDGPDGVLMGEDGLGRAYGEFQKALLALQSRGTLLVLCTRNNPADVEEVFARRRDMVLPRDRIAAAHIGWGPKSEGFRQLSGQLGLALRDFVFLDDNPVEREEVRTALPEVAVPEFPADAADLAAFAYDLGWRYFYRLALHQEDRSKTEQYRVRAEFESQRVLAPNREDFLRSLNMRSVIATNSAGLVARAAQLTQKTNQFNLTLRRYTEAEIRQLIEDRANRVYCATLSDRMGEHGWVALAILTRAEDERCWWIDTLLLSCRVLGRGFEQAFAEACIQRARALDRLPVRAKYVPGPRNAQVRDFFDNLGFRLLGEEPDGGREYLLDPAEAAGTSPACPVDIVWEDTQQ
jgi:FkbH-like protein